MDGIRLLKIVRVANVLGECILWNDLEDAFLWTDIQDRKLYRYHPASDDLTWWDTPERLCSFGLVHGGAEDPLIAAFESGIGMYRYRSGEVEWLARPEEAVSGTRFNDGRVDRQGRFWTGTMIEGDRAVDARGEEVTAALYRLDRDECSRMRDGLRITNSLCWSLDSTRQYLADSPTRVIHRYDFHPATGTLLDRRVFARVESPGEPDGSCIDAEDHLWNAHWGSAQIVRYRPDGSVSLVLPLPVSQPTCICFGGRELNLLAVTSARDQLDESTVAGQPLAGAMFLFETEYRGVPEARYIR
jgi:L-arabinonolactonase